VTDDVECWCCATPSPPDELIHLGNHPEVTVCRQCAHFLHRQARAMEDADRTGLSRGVQVRLRHARGVVIQHGWHRLPVVGALLRRLGRHLP
jgi:hypothetical protein